MMVREVERRKVGSHGRMAVTCLSPWLGTFAIFAGDSLAVGTVCVSEGKRKRTVMVLG